MDSKPHYPDPSTQVNNDYPEAQDSKPREASTARTTHDYDRYNPSQKVDEAITSAFDQETPNSLPPDLIAKITQNVIQQLHQSGGLETSTPVPSQSRFSPPQPTVHQPVPISPSTASGASSNMPGRVFTPPSPQKHSDYPGHVSPTHSHSGYRPDGPESLHDHKGSHFSPPRGSLSSQSHTSDSSDRVYTRPKGPPRLSTSTKVTTLEKIWGQLFDEESHPTVRLGQLLRGLAIHLVRTSIYLDGLTICSKATRRSRITNLSIALSSRPIRW